MHRLMLSKLISWKNKQKRKPLLLDGARQVGKSYLLSQLFGKAEFQSVHVIDLLKDPKAHQIFEGDLSSKTVLSGIELYLNKQIDPTIDLIVLDEIGECVRAINALKFIKEEHDDWYVCASGSNIGLTVGFPVGQVQMMTLRPMNFEEFLMASGEELAIAAFNDGDRRSIAHEVLWPILVDYFYVGGMPEAVFDWFEGKDLSLVDRRSSVRKIQMDILAGYERDFGKYSGGVNAGHLNRVYQSVAVQLQKYMDAQVGRYIFKGVIEKKKQYKDFANIIDWLEKAHLVSKNKPVNCEPKIPLQIFTSASHFKLFLSDVGLLCAMLGVRGSVLALGDMLYKGPIVENFIQTELLSYGCTHTYSWKENTAELEFLLETDVGILPIEVKSGKNTQAKSLKSYVNRYKPEFTLKLIGSVGGTDEKTRVLPLYYCNTLREYF